MLPYIRTKLHSVLTGVLVTIPINLFLRNTRYILATKLQPKAAPLFIFIKCLEIPFFVCHCCAELQFMPISSVDYYRLPVVGSDMPGLCTQLHILEWHSEQQVTFRRLWYFKHLVSFIKNVLIWKPHSPSAYFPFQIHHFQFLLFIISSYLECLDFLSASQTTSFVLCPLEVLELPSQVVFKQELSSI